MRLIFLSSQLTSNCSVLCTISPIPTAQPVRRTDEIRPLSWRDYTCAYIYGVRIVCFARCDSAWLSSEDRFVDFYGIRRPRRRTNPGAISMKAKGSSNRHLTSVVSLLCLVSDAVILESVRTKVLCVLKPGGFERHGL